MHNTNLGEGLTQSIFKPDNWWVTQAPLNTQTTGATSKASHFNLHEPCVNYAMSDGCSDKERSDSEDDKMEIFERGGDDTLVQAAAEAGVSEPLCVSSNVSPQLRSKNVHSDRCVGRLGVGRRRADPTKVLGEQAEARTEQPMHDETVDFEGDYYNFPAAE